MEWRKALWKSGLWFFVLFWWSVFLQVAVGSTEAGLREVVVGEVHVTYSEWDSSLYVYIMIRGTGDVTGRDGYLYVSNNSPNAQPGDLDNTVQAFLKLATSLGCSVGTIHQDPMMPEEGVYFTFICEDMRNRLISVLGEMMKFSVELEFQHWSNRQ